MTDYDEYPLLREKWRQEERELQSIEDQKHAVEENQRMHERRPGYEAWAARSSMVIPRPPRAEG